MFPVTRMQRRTSMRVTSNRTTARIAKFLPNCTHGLAPLTGQPLFLSYCLRCYTMPYLMQMKLHVLGALFFLFRLYLY